MHSSIFRRRVADAAPRAALRCHYACRAYVFLRCAFMRSTILAALRAVLRRAMMLE